jgi:polysaccharide export outer membrane protein
MKFQIVILFLVNIFAFCGLSGCSTYSPWFASSGPSAEQLTNQSDLQSPIPVIDVNDQVARHQLAAQKHNSFSESLPDSKAAQGYVVGPGDVLTVSIWEAPPAVLFGSAVMDPKASIATTRETSLPEQMVAEDGTINVPFAGSVPVAGKSPQQIESEIVKRLAGKANEPQVLVRVSRNVTANVTVVGEVAQSVRMPLTAKGERLLDAMAAAGGVKQPVGKTTVQISRGKQVLAMPLDSVIQDARQNIRLQPGDVVTALYQPLSFTALGATGKNDEVTFEAQGITLAQALGRINGLQDMRSDARGLFLFRFEDPAAFDGDAKSVPHTPEGLIPVVYRLDLRDPRSFLVSQNFPMRNKDVVYVANAPSAELQKFLNILTSSVFTVSSLVVLKP